MRETGHLKDQFGNMRAPRQLLRFTTVVLAACLAWPAPATAQAVAELYVTPDTLLLSAGERRGLTVQAFDAAGNIILAVRYSVADTAVARVAENGTVTGLRGGRTKITVQAGKKSATVVVIVAGDFHRDTAPDPMAAKVTRLAADPASISLLPTERAHPVVSAFGADEAPVPLSRLRWRSLRPDVATVMDTLGVITGVASGQATIEASVPGGVAVTIPVTVALAPIALDRTAVALAPGGTDTVLASVPAQSGRQLRGDDLIWRVQDPSVAEVSSSGAVHALAMGRTELVVAGFLQEKHLPLVVHPPVSYFLTLPRVSEPARIPVSTSREFEVAPYTADSTLIPNVPITWTVGDTTIAAFDTATRRLTGLGIGRTTLTFAARGFLARGWTVEVIPGTLGFERKRAVLRPGEEVIFKAGLVDDTGRIIGPAPELRWSSSDTAKGVVSAHGTLVARAPGRVTVRAELENGVAAEALAFITGEALLASNRSGQVGIHAVAFAWRDTLYPVVVDASRNVEGTYAPDRTRIAFSSDRGGGNFNIYVADADGRNPVRLTSDPANEGQPAWSPDGQHLVFVSSRGGPGQLLVVPASGGAPRALASPPGGAADPAISPDGGTVAFTTFPNGPDKPSDIATVPFLGGTPTVITSTRDRREFNPLYLSRGELAWIEQPGDSKEPDLITSRTAGGTPVVLARSNNQIVSAATSKDGKTLAWVIGQASERDKKVVDYLLRIRALATGQERFIRFPSGERIASVGF